ncbi:MAG: hypothetical protein NHB14_20835 [Desulfosporosinus sp.]|nr:hypothetical protein [Desulfosporosinus sp.]
MIVKVEVQTEYERFIIRIPNISDDLKPETLAGQTVSNILSAVDEGHVVFQGADDREGQLIFINGGSKNVKHIALLGEETEAPAIDQPDTENDQSKGPVPFRLTTNFASQSVTITGVEYRYLKPENGELKQASAYVPVFVNGKPALDVIGPHNLNTLLINAVRSEGHERWHILVPPGVVTWEQAVEYANDWVTEELMDKPHVAEEKTATAYFGLRPEKNL